MKFLEQQLIATLTEMPAETDCTVSVQVLTELGKVGLEAQKDWLLMHRAAWNERAWHCVGAHWEYTASPHHELEQYAIKVPTAADWKNSPPTPPRPARIVVKPLPNLG